MKRKIIMILSIILLTTTSYNIGKYQAETNNKTEVETIETETIPFELEAIEHGYIKLEDCIPLEDIAGYFIDDYDYPCFELKDVGNQLDNPEMKNYQEIMEKLTDLAEDF